MLGFKREDGVLAGKEKEMSKPPPMNSMKLIHEEGGRSYMLEHGDRNYVFTATANDPPAPCEKITMQATADSLSEALVQVANSRFLDRLEYSAVSDNVTINVTRKGN